RIDDRVAEELGHGGMELHTQIISVGFVGFPDPRLFQICNERPDGWLIEQPPVRRRLFHDSARSRIFSANWACGLRGDGYHPRAISTQSKRVLTKRRGFMKIRPLQDRILVRRVKEEEKTKGGIIIPDTAKEKPVEGEIVAVGTGKVLEGG